MHELHEPTEIALGKILDHLLEGCQVISFDYRYLYINESVARQGRKKKKELLGQKMQDVYPGIEKTEMFKHLKNSMEKRTFFNMDNEFVFPNGGAGWFELRMEPVHEGILILSLDITERKKAEIETITTRRKLNKTLDDLAERTKMIEDERVRDEAILTSIGEGLIATDAAGKITLINRAAQEMLGYTREEVMDKMLVDKIMMEDKLGKPLLLQNRPTEMVVATGKSISNSGEYVYVRKDGSKVPLALTQTPIIIDEEILGSIQVFRDITKEQAIDKAKSEFVSIASHALRTPLGIAKWYLEAISGEGYMNEAPDEFIKYLDEIYKNNERLLVLVRNLLSVSRIDQGKLKDSPQGIDIIDFMQEVTRDMQIAALKDHITVNLTISQEHFPKVFIDPLHLREVVENLISNAIKYSLPQKNIDVTLDKKDEFFLIIVRDNGIGISEDDQKNIFSKFFRAERAISNNTEGSGLGLYVVKSYIDSWGGTITVESKEGKGATFTIKLPIKKNE